MLKLRNIHHASTVQEGTHVSKKDVLGVTQVDTDGQALYPGNSFALIDYFRDPTNANMTTNKNMNVNGSVTNVTFRLAPSAGYVYYLGALHIVLSDGTVRVDRWGAVLLTNGHQVKITKNSITSNIIPNENVLDTQELLNHAADVEFKIAGTGPQTLFGAIKIRDFADRALTLDGDLGDKIEWVVRDNITTLTYFRVTGIGLQYVKAQI